MQYFVGRQTQQPLSMKTFPLWLVDRSLAKAIFSVLLGSAKAALLNAKSSGRVGRLTCWTSSVRRLTERPPLGCTPIRPLRLDAPPSCKVIIPFTVRRACSGRPFAMQTLSLGLDMPLVWKIFMSVGARRSDQTSLRDANPPLRLDVPLAWEVNFLVRSCTQG